MMKFQNTYIQLPERFYSLEKAARFNSPKVICFNDQLAGQLGIETKSLDYEELALIFSGQKILPGSRPLAMAYAGFQFGHPVAQLGDGRALLLGEVAGFDIQLKGQGQTIFSRRGDGKSALGPVIREYIVSESMHALGVPTTRALCAISTGESVYRQDGPEPGGVLTRVAQGHVRVGTFQYFSFRNDREALEILLDYTLKRHYPDLVSLPLKEKALHFLRELGQKQADLIAMWSSFGFIHGVMNTDNFSVVPITLDYGPCAFMDEFRFHQVFSSIDQRGRYSFFNQVPIAQWNLLRLADCLLPLIDENQKYAIEAVEKELEETLPVFFTKRMERLAKKIGIQDYSESDEELVMDFLKYLESESLDFTLAFRNLPALYAGEREFYPDTEMLRSFLKRWKERVSKVDHLDSINPLYIPRNHQVKKAIDQAYGGKHEHFKKMLQVLQTPFHESKGAEEFALAPKDFEKVSQTFCGT